MKPRTPRMKRLEREKAERINRRGLRDTSLVDQFEGFDWTEIAKIRDKAKAEQSKSTAP